MGDPFADEWDELGVPEDDGAEPDDAEVGHEHVDG